MKDVIKKVLDEVFDIVENYEYTITPKYIRHEISIFDVSPIELPKFMIDNNIPSNAEFAGIENGYDAFSDFVLEWYEEVPMTDDEIKIQIDSKKREKFRRIVLKTLRETLSLYVNEYRFRAPFKEMKKAPIYDMYVSGDIDGLVDYYLEIFIKRG